MFDQWKMGLLYILNPNGGLFGKVWVNIDEKTAFNSSGQSNAGGRVNNQFYVGG